MSGDEETFFDWLWRQIDWRMLVIAGIAVVVCLLVLILVLA